MYKKNHDEILYLALKAPPSHCVHSILLIHQSRSRSEKDILKVVHILKTRREILICGLQESLDDAIIDVRFGD